jgi:hypothetical protein
VTDTLAFHAAAPGGAEGFVILLHRPEADGRLRTVEWPAGAYLDPGRPGETTPDELLARVRGWRSRGWSFSEPVERIESWLRHPPR